MAPVVLLGLGEEAVDPREEGLGAVVGVQDHRHAVLRRQPAHVVRARHGAAHGRRVVGVVEALARVKLRAARRELDHDGRARLGGGLEAGVDARRRHAVHRGDRVPARLRVLEEVDDGLPGEHAGLHRRRQVGIGARAVAHAGPARRRASPRSRDPTAARPAAPATPPSPRPHRRRSARRSHTTTAFAPASPRRRQGRPTTARRAWRATRPWRPPRSSAAARRGSPPCRRPGRRAASRQRRRSY